jgi:Flp pilus assembly protein TadB
VIDRARRDVDPFLDWKVRVFFIGAVLVAAGVFLGQRILVLLAIIVLAAGLMGMKVLAVRRQRREEAEAMEEQGEAEDLEAESGGDTRPS